MAGINPMGYIYYFEVFILVRIVCNLFNENDI